MDVLPVMGPHDWHSKKSVYIAPNDYDTVTAMSQMAVASSEMLEELPSTFPNFRGYFLLGDAHHFFRKYMEKSKHPILIKEKIVHPTAIACKRWDTDHQCVTVCQACIALSAATGMDFHHFNIKIFYDIMPVLASMKHISVDRQDAAIHRLEEKEVVKTAKSEERLDAAVRRLEEKEMKEDGGDYFSTGAHTTALSTATRGMGAGAAASAAACGAGAGTLDFFWRL